MAVAPTDPSRDRPRREGPSRDRSWTVPLGRACVALVVAAITTFVPNHSAHLGLLVFGGFGLITGVIVVLVTLLTVAKGVPRTLFVVSGVVSFALGIAALLLERGGLGWFLTLVSLWAALTGVIELYAGLRSRRRLPAARDWITIGGLSLLLAIVFLVIPPDFVKHFTGPDGVHRSLTSSVVMVGVFGAYSAIVCVYLGIAAFSLKWGAQDAEKARAEADGRALVDDEGADAVAGQPAADGIEAGHGGPDASATGPDRAKRDREGLR